MSNQIKSDKPNKAAGVVTGMIVVAIIIWIASKVYGPNTPSTEPTYDSTNFKGHAVTCAQHQSNERHLMYTFIDLFAGIGGFRTALEQRGMKCVFSSEIDEKAKEAYFNNFGETPHGDITEIPEKKIPPHDILCAGFPCQSFSISGSSKGFDDDRGRLFYEIVRIAQYHQPHVLLLENVKNILTIDNGNVIKTIENKLDEIGYTINKHVLNASYFGIPQSRELP